MALVRDGSTVTMMSGDMDDIRDIESAQRAIDGEFLWFRRDGRSWIVRDPATIAKARAAWSRTDALSKEMERIEVRMRPHSQRMEALAAQMDRYTEPDPFDTPEARAADARMEALGRQMEPLAEQQVVLAMRLRNSSDADRARIETEMEALGRRQEALGEEMERQGEILEAASERLERHHAPIEALGRQMEAEGEKMELVGREMEALGARIEREALVAETQMRSLVDAAVRSGKAQPAPARR
jgi:chromosome segregation ATPase